ALKRLESAITSARAVNVPLTATEVTNSKIPDSQNAATDLRSAAIWLQSGRDGDTANSRRPFSLLSQNPARKTGPDYEQALKFARQAAAKTECDFGHDPDNYNEVFTELGDA